MDMKNLIMLSAIVLGFISCESDPPEPHNSNTVSRGSYAILINNTTTGEQTQLIDSTADASWDPTTGTIFLNTDDSLNCPEPNSCPCLRGPIGTVSMTTSIVRNTSHGDFTSISAILVSKSDVVCGTAEQINAKLFAGGSAELYAVEIGANYVTGRFDDVPMELQVVNPNQQPETAKVSCVFIALKQ